MKLFQKTSGIFFFKKKRHIRSQASAGITTHNSNVKEELDCVRILVRLLALGEVLQEIHGIRDKGNNRSSSELYIHISTQVQ